jgi:hypothetical protein
MPASDGGYDFVGVGERARLSPRNPQSSVA